MAGDGSGESRPVDKRLCMMRSAPEEQAWYCSRLPGHEGPHKAWRGHDVTRGLVWDGPWEDGRPHGYRHVGSLPPYGHDGMGWLGGVDIFVKAEDYDRHLPYQGDDHRLWADNVRLRRTIETLLSPPFGHYAEWRKRGDVVDADAMDRWQEVVDNARAVLNELVPNGSKGAPQ